MTLSLSTIVSILATLAPIATMVVAAFAWHRSRVRAAELKVERANVAAVMEAKKIEDGINALGKADLEKKWQEWGAK